MNCIKFKVNFNIMIIDYYCCGTFKNQCCTLDTEPPPWWVWLIVGGIMLIVVVGGVACGCIARKKIISKRKAQYEMANRLANSIPQTNFPPYPQPYQQPVYPQGQNQANPEAYPTNYSENKF